MNNRDYARILGEVASLMQIKGVNQFRVRAFENAAHTIEAETRPIEELIERGEMTELSGIGEGIATQLEQIRERGTCDHLEELLDELDPGLLDLLRIQGLGPKRIRVIYDELKIVDLETLQRAAEQNEIRALSGFGKKTEEKILAEIERLAQTSGRIPLPTAQSVAESLRDQLGDVEGVESIDIAGSLRRGRETVGDIDLLVATENPEPVHQAFQSLVEVAEVLVSGQTKTSVRLRSGVQVDLRTVAPEIFGSALHYFTGSKDHHVALRTRAKRQGLKISEYGVFGDDEEKPLASRTEQELFEALDLDYIPPELREGHDEIEAASRGELPDLVELTDIRGDLHMHTTETDGRASIEEMARAGAARGYDYIAITDHSQAVRVANGMNPARFAAQIDEVHRVDDTVDEIRIFAGIEVDILKDGSLDMDHELLAACDWVVASIHSHFNLSKDAMTKRLISAIKSGLISCLGHPTGRILGGRDGYDYDFEQVVDCAVEYDVALEINGSTGRLDLNCDLARHAHERGAMLVLGSDAHSRRGLEDMRFAVQQARRAGLEAESIVNTRSPERLLKAVAKTSNRD